MNYATVENGAVVNVIVGPLPDGMDGVCVDGLDAAIGDRYVDGEFVRSEPVSEPSIEDQIAALETQRAALMAQLVALKAQL